MNEHAKNDPNDPALTRYSAVSWVQQALAGGMSFSESCQQAAGLAWEGRYYSARTIEGWFYDYTGKGFAQLQNSPRADAGKSRVLSPEQAEAILALLREQPRLGAKAAVRHLLDKGVLSRGFFSMASVYRLLHSQGVDRRSRAFSLQVGRETNGPSKAFEFSRPNAMWMSDVMNGPWIKPKGGGKAFESFLIATLDDYSRLCPHGQYYDNQKLHSLLESFKQAFCRRGLPEKLYCDQGKIFRSGHLAVVCANLGIKLIHAKPYAAWSKGKIERFFQTVQTDFEARLKLDPVFSLEELNRRFLQWLEADYHRRAHRGIDGQTPAARFFEGKFRMRELTGDWKPLFYLRVKRRVRLDATVSLEAELWEVPVALRGQEVEVRYDPYGQEGPREVWFRGELAGTATRCDKRLNAVSFTSSKDYERRTH